MADVFLSYKREDINAAKYFADGLRAEGFSVFFDAQVAVGDSWDRTIEREIGAARAVVVLWSPRSCESPWVRREARDAASRGILCPALVETCELPLEFSDIQAVNLVEWSTQDTSHPEWRRLCDRISECSSRSIESSKLSKSAIVAIRMSEGDVPPIGVRRTFELSINGATHILEYNYRAFSTSFLKVDGSRIGPSGIFGSKWNGDFDEVFQFRIAGLSGELRTGAKPKKPWHKLSIDGQTVFASDPPVSGGR